MITLNEKFKLDIFPSNTKTGLFCYLVTGLDDLSFNFSLFGGGGGCNQKKLNATANFEFETGFFFGFSIFANFYWFNGFLS